MLRFAHRAFDVVQRDIPDGDRIELHGACMDDPSPQPGCGAKACAAQGQECMEDGYCHYPCENTRACQLIDSRFVGCEDGFCKTREEVAPECSLDEPCPDGKDCISGECL